MRLSGKMSGMACALLVLAGTARAQAFPAAGSDTFTTTTELVITIDAAGGNPDAGMYPQTTFTGPVTIQRSDSHTGGTVVDLTMTTLFLQGNVFGLGPVTLTLNGVGTGTATSLGTPGFPATSALSVPYTLTANGVTYIGGPHNISNTITSFPGLSDGSYSVAGSTFAAGPFSGSLVSPAHQPTSLISSVPSFGLIALVVLVLGAVGGCLVFMRRT